MNKKTWAEVVGFDGLTFVMKPKRFDLEDTHPDDDTLEIDSYFHFQGERGVSHTSLTNPPDSYTPESVLMFLNILLNQARKSFLAGVYAILKGENPDEKMVEYEEKIERIMERTERK